LKDASLLSLSSLRATPESSVVKILQSGRRIDHGVMYNIFNPILTKIQYEIKIFKI